MFDLKNRSFDREMEDMAAEFKDLGSDGNAL